MAEGCGTCACVYGNVEIEANIEEVAVDLRNQAPTVLFVPCYDEEQATNMQSALCKEIVNTNTRDDGGKKKGKQPRERPEDFQVQFKCVVVKAHSRGAVWCGERCCRQAGLVHSR